MQSFGNPKWRGDHCRYQLNVFRERYRQVNAIGQRTVTSEAITSHMDPVGARPPRESGETLPMNARFVRYTFGYEIANY